MTNHPEITVLTAVYNGERYLREAIGSILNQTYKNFEYILVDNNSTDNTPKILNDYAQKDERIKIIKETRQSPACARNAGLQVAKGKWIAILDADDISHPERLEHQYIYMINHPNCYFLATEGILIGESSKKLKDIRINFKGFSQKDYFLNYGTPFVHSSMMFSKQKVLELGGYDENYKVLEDLELWLRVIYSGMEISLLREPLVEYRYHSQSLSHKSIGNLYLKVIIKALYRAKDLGITNINSEKIEKVIKREPVINTYIQRVIARRRLKNMLDFFISGDLIKGIGLFFRLIPDLHLTLSKPIQLVPVIDVLLKNIQTNHNGRDNDTFETKYF